MIIYDMLYDILNTYIYGNPEVLSSFQELTLTELATAGSVFVCALPLCVVYWLFRFIATLGNRW